MTRSKKQNDQRLEFHSELLETRHMMAGDVSVEVRGGNLIVEGDDVENQIAIRQEGNLTIVDRVSDTRINGGLESFSTDEVTRDIRIDLDGGNDLVFFGGGDVPRDIRFTGDTGSQDSFIMNGSGSLRRFRGRSGGSLKVALRDLTADRIDLRSAAGADVEIDNAILSDRSNVRTNDGETELTISNSNLENFRFQNRSGDATVLISDTSMTGSLRVETGRDNDLVDVRDSNLEDLRIRTRDGDDLAILFNSAMNQADLRFDDGDDLGIYQEVTIAEHRANGGAGADELTTLGNMGDFETRNFETENVLFKVTGVSFVDQNGNGIQELPNDFALPGSLSFVHEDGTIDRVLIDNEDDGQFEEFVKAGQHVVTFTHNLGETTFDLNVSEDLFFAVAVPNN